MNHPVDSEETPDRLSGSRKSSGRNEEFAIRLSISEFVNPIVRDALVIGKSSPIENAALRRALGLLMVIPFEHITIEDDVIGDILVRRPILKRIPRDVLIRLIVRNVKPRMDSTEIVQVRIDAEVGLRDEITSAGTT
jgi:hypothetical protein